jgi:large conductance mechanosensitive channel
MFNEFKEFAMKGNLVDMAVGFVMGAAFAAVVTAFIQGVFMPLISPILGGIDLASMNYVMSPAEVDADGTETKAAVIVAVGEFITALISFIIVAFVMFMIIKGMNNAMKAEEEAPAEDPGPSQEDLLTEIRDLLAKSS